MYVVYSEYYFRDTDGLSLQNVQLVACFKFLAGKQHRIQFIKLQWCGDRRESVARRRLYTMTLLEPRWIAARRLLRGPRRQRPARRGKMLGARFESLVGRGSRVRLCAVVCCCCC
jgi:hypothetical protein